MYRTRLRLRYISLNGHQADQTRSVMYVGESNDAE